VSTLDRQANLLGAFAAVLTDVTTAQMTAASGLAASDMSALSALRHFLRKPTIDQLHQVLGLTPSGAVRLVDRLARRGFVTRGPGADRRERSVELTARGRRVADRITAARADALCSSLADLNPAQRETLHELISQVMVTVVTAKSGGAWICRQCDLRACGRAEGLCPTANAAAAKYLGPRATAAESGSNPGS
jgi:DNA-binding MarR family transcriptional regulator